VCNAESCIGEHEDFSWVRCFLMTCLWDESEELVMFPKLRGLSVNTCIQSRNDASNVQYRSSSDSAVLDFSYGTIVCTASVRMSHIDWKTMPVQSRLLGRRIADWFLQQSILLRLRDMIVPSVSRNV